MIEIYVKTNTDYNKNGDITLTPTSCIYKDSEKELVLEHIQDEEGRWKYIEFENVIAAEENEIKKLYRIYNVVKTLNSVTAYARPIFYDLIDKVLLDVRPKEKNGQEALDMILADTGFKGHSNILSLNTAYYVRKNIVEALIGDANNSFIKRWGGEFYCENFDIYINYKVGSDNGVKVEFGYNLNEIEENINIEDVVTRIIPVGFNGIMLEGESPWIDSPLINKYTHIKSRIVEFSNIKVKEGSDEEGFETIEEAREEMIKQCKLLYENGADKPSINYKIDMINLANTTEYEHLKMLVNVNKGDTVTCYIKHLDIDVKARVIDYERDMITGEYISIELGNTIDNFFDNQADIQHKVDNIFNDNENIKAETLEGVINALQTKFEALRDVAQPQQVRAILFEDRIEDSPTFGAMALGTIGFEIAGKFKPGTKEWDFRTFGTGQGFVADHIITGVLNAALIKAGILKSENKKTWINMEDGTFNFADKVKFDGEKFTIDLTGEDLTTNESIKVAFKIMNDAISSKVSSGDFEAYQKITDKKIESKVTAITGDITSLQRRVDTAEQKITPAAITSTISSSINNGSSISTTKFVMDKKGLTIKNGGLTIKNNAGTTVLSSDTSGNLKLTGHLETCTFRGKNMIYIEDNGTLSCDGVSYIKDLRIPLSHPGWSGTGAFWCGPSALFDKEVKTKGEFWAKNNSGDYLGVIRRGAGGSGKIQIDRLRVINLSSKNYMEIVGYQSNHVFGVDLWSSDIALKENIVSIEDDSNTELLNNDTSKTGLDLINNLNHYAFDYKESFGGGHVTCGYVAQELQELNDNLVMKIEQQDGTTLLQPKASNIIPNLSLAIKQQQKMIDDLKSEIEHLKK